MQKFLSVCLPNILALTPWHRVCRMKASLQSDLLETTIYQTKYTGCHKKWEKSNHLFWCKNRVKLLIVAHHLGGNITPFSLLTLTIPWWHFLKSKLRMQKMLKNDQNSHIGLFWLINSSKQPIEGLFDTKEPPKCTR